MASASIAFGNRPLKCVLRSGTGRPLPGGLAANVNPDHNSGCQHSPHANVSPEATRFEGDKKVPSKRKGKSTEKRGLSRGGKPNSSIDSKPRQPPENGWLSKVSRGDRTPIELFLAGVASWEPYVERLLIAA